MTRLIIWRHGQTEWNASNRIQGHHDVDLDDLGHTQAMAAAEVLAGEHPDLIVSSDLRRAVDTAAALATATGLAVHRDPRLRERYFGIWQGMTGPEAKAAYPQEYARWRHGEPVGGCDVEELDDLAKRVTAAVFDAVDQTGGGTVVIVTHGGSARHILGGMLGWSRDVTGRIAGLANCHWSELRHEPDRGWLLRAHNVGVPHRGRETA